MPTTALKTPDLGRVDINGGSWVKKLLSSEPSASRVRKLADRVAQIASRLPVGPAAPAVVIDKRDALLVALRTAADAATALEAAQEALGDAHQADVRTAATALRKGTAVSASAQTRPKASAAEALALTTCLAAETMVLDALANLLDATRESWQAWRSVLIQDAEAASVEVTAAVEAAAVAAARWTAALGAVAALDHEIVRRFADDALEHGLPVEYDGIGRPVLNDRPRADRINAILGVDAPLAELAARVAEMPPWALALKGE